MKMTPEMIKIIDHVLEKLVDMPDEEFETMIRENEDSEMARTLGYAWEDHK